MIVVFCTGIYVFYKTWYTEPTISVSAEVTPLTDEEFKNIGVKGLVDPKASDFKRFVFTLKATDFPRSSDRKITIPRVQESLNSYDGKHRYWYGKSFSHDNRNESFAEYGYDFVFYEKGLDESKIKDIYKSEILVVSWTPKGKSERTERFSIGDILYYKKK